MRITLPVLLLTLTLFSNSHAAILRNIDADNDIFVPGPKTAAAEDAWSLFHNPAGIAFVDGAQLVGGYSYRLQTGLDALHQSEGALSLSIFEGVSLAAGLQLALPQAQSVADMGIIGGNFGAAFRAGRFLAFGVRAVKQMQYLNTVSDPLWFSIGIEAFPTSWLSLGVNTKQVYDDFFAKPEIHVGIAVRPFGENFTLSAESGFSPRSISLNTDFSIHPEIGARLDVAGVSLLASARIDNIENGFSTPTISAGLEVNFDHFGLGPVSTGRPFDRLNAGGRFRLSSEAWPSLVAQKSMVAIELDENAEAHNQTLSLKRRLFGPGSHPVEILHKFSELTSENAVSTVVIRFRPFSFGFARAQEIREAILAMRSSGKKVYVHFDSANASTYFAATGADKIFMSPAGEIQLDDFRTSLLYMHESLAAVGIDVEAVTAGKYKSAPDMFTKSGPSPEALEVRNSILDQNYALFASVLSHFTKSDLDSVKKTIDLGAVSASEAKQMGLIHDIAYADQLPEGLSIRAAQISQKKTRWGDVPKIAIIPVQGMIVSGHIKPTIFRPAGSQTGAQNIIDALDQAVSDKQTAAIVLRIDSPGGDALASNLVYHAVMQARTKKPIVASMADIAASGGYYIASAAHSIFAEPTTLTGSIGVFSLIPSVERLSKNLGAKLFELKRAKNPGPTFMRSITQEERARKQVLINHDYDLFKKNVAEARGVDVQTINAVAEGRVWTGSDAVNNGLINAHGGFSHAIAHARKLAQISDTDTIELNLLAIAPQPLFALPKLASAFSIFDEGVNTMTGAPMALSSFSYTFPSFLKE